MYNRMPELINNFDIEKKFKIHFKVNKSDSSRTIEAVSYTHLTLPTSRSV